MTRVKLKKIHIVLSIGVFIIWFLVVRRFTSYSEKYGTEPRFTYGSRFVPKFITVGFTERENFFYDSTVRNLFLPAGVGLEVRSDTVLTGDKSISKTPVVDFKVSGILYSKGNPLVIIQDDLYGRSFFLTVGDTIRDFKLLKTYPDSVIFEAFNGDRVKLTVGR
ncbi:MAG: hypothetical protein H0Z29_07905 [Candidatus Marinimicrobia bacterium]|nr:hypothetical protein [Candidatus Neomarinimicrobiota bacterium]